MDRQEIKENLQPAREDFIVGKFGDRQEAKIAAKFLEEASFPVEQIQIKTLPLKESLELPESPKSPKSNEVKEGTAAAILGAALGITIGLSLNLIVGSLPDANLSIDLSPLLIVIISGVLGALSLGLIGTISTGQFPTTDTKIDEDSTSFDYGLIIAGKEEDLDRAKQILRQQGM
jgi:hypothetical protein